MPSCLADVIPSPALQDLTHARHGWKGVLREGSAAAASPAPPCRARRLCGWRPQHPPGPGRARLAQAPPPYQSSSQSRLPAAIATALAVAAGQDLQRRLACSGQAQVQARRVRRGTAGGSRRAGGGIMGVRPRTGHIQQRAARRQLQHRSAERRAGNGGSSSVRGGARGGAAAAAVAAAKRVAAAAGCLFALSDCSTDRSAQLAQARRQACLCGGAVGHWLLKPRLATSSQAPSRLLMSQGSLHACVEATERANWAREGAEAFMLSLPTLAQTRLLVRKLPTSQLQTSHACTTPITS